MVDFNDYPDHMESSSENRPPLDGSPGVIPLNLVRFFLVTGEIVEGALPDIGLLSVLLNKKIIEHVTLQAKEITRVIRDPKEAKRMVGQKILYAGPDKKRPVANEDELRKIWFDNEAVYYPYLKKPCLVKDKKIIWSDQELMIDLQQVAFVIELEQFHGSPAWKKQTARQPMFRFQVKSYLAPLQTYIEGEINTSVRTIELFLRRFPHFIPLLKHNSEPYKNHAILLSRQHVPVFNIQVLTA
ncbi:MAG: hypothetical protein HQK57_14275 [Deltaproteobacteria bacterium]|nr:hypothetical protein [Deltaproteobacteria bacterium]